VTTTTTYRVSGLTCEHCVRAVSGELTALAGVRQVAVDLVAGGESRVTVSTDRDLPVEAVAGALAEAGDYALVGAGAAG
jgi:copper chaperone CopZ